MIVCTDAGLASYNNRAFNDRAGRAFICTQSIKKLPAHLKEWALNDSDWKLANLEENSESNKKTVEDTKNKDNIEYKPSNVNAFEKGTIIYKARYMKEKCTIKDTYGNDIKMEQSWRLIVKFSRDYALYQKDLRKEQFERAKDLIKNPGKFNKVNSNDCRRFVKNIYFDDNGEITKSHNMVLDQELFDEESKYDGFYALSTNLDSSPEEIININHNRWKIEQCFRIMKTDFSARPVYHYKNERIETHFLICYLALLLVRIFERKLKGKYTVEEILRTVKSFCYLQLDQGYIPTFPGSKVLASIAKTFNMDFLRLKALDYKNMSHLINTSGRY